LPQDKRKSAPKAIVSFIWMPTDQDRIWFLRHGKIRILGAIPHSSNLTLLCVLEYEQEEELAVYKPLSGERPLSDFPPGLYKREILAYELSAYLNLDLVPETIEREAQYGIGSLQRFIPNNFSQNYFTLLEDVERLEILRLLCGFDLLINNADRKASHIICGDDNNLYAIDHGLCFHTEDKLRTVIWDFVGEALPNNLINACKVLLDDKPDFLSYHLSNEELSALFNRAEVLGTQQLFPYPPDGRFFYPWPMI